MIWGLETMFCERFCEMFRALEQDLRFKAQELDSYHDGYFCGR